MRALALEGIVESPEPPQPDFVVSSDGRRIGVEITEYHRPRIAEQPHPRTQVESEWGKLRSAVANYREHHSELDRLGVYLAFENLIVPPEHDHVAFVNAVAREIEKVLPTLTSDRPATIRLDHSHPKILSIYLTKIVLRRVRSYMPWNWNHSFAGVGTSDSELVQILGRKLSRVRPNSIDELHLVVAGDGPTGGSYIGLTKAEWLEGWPLLNQALGKSAYDVFAILGYEEASLWRRGFGWSQLAIPT
jgi:hypothetical protein